MKKNLLLTIFSLSIGFSAFSQQESYVQQGELGITLGAAHYFGDLNPRAAINRPKPAIGVYFLKQFNNYLGARISGHFAQVGYSDKYSSNEFQQQRNLSFNSNIFELALQGEFNFFKYVPGDPNHSYTPYITLGIGLFTYDPYAYLGGQKVYLRPLGTEGQNISYKDPSTGKTRSPYSNMAICLPFGIGFKYNINNNFNISFQIANRFTTTDYLDDVSTTYVGADKFPLLPNGDPSPAKLLQDRSYEKGTAIGTVGRQRGWSKQKDQYIIAEVGLSYNLSGYRCPTSY